MSTPDYTDYHDTEWGRVLHGEADLYERLALETFQAGLSWLTILRRREAFRRAFAGFDPEAVARFGDQDRGRLLADRSIVRNRAKINAVIANATAVLRLRESVDGGLDSLVWSFARTPPAVQPAYSGGGAHDLTGGGGVGPGTAAARVHLPGADDGVRRDAGHGPGG